MASVVVDCNGTAKWKASTGNTIPDFQTACPYKTCAASSQRSKEKQGRSDVA